MKTKHPFVLKLHVDQLMINVLLGVFLIVLITAGSISAQQNQNKTAIPKDQKQRQELMKSKGVDASLTILPAGLMGRPEVRVSEVIGVLLEQQGLKNIELWNKAYITLNKPQPKALADSVGKFVKTQPITTDYVLYAEMNGEPQKHQISELQGIVVDKSGAVVFTDFLGLQDEVFKQVEDPDPMGYSMLLVQRLSPQFGLSDETARNARPGKMADILNERSGLPREKERAAMPDRQKVLKANFAQSGLVVFPVRTLSGSNSKAATDVVKMINDAGMCKAMPSKDTLLLKTPQKDPNELKLLWDLAHDFRAYVQKNPQDADYTLYADYAMPGYVHFIVCDRSGEWVIADLQNSMHPDFRNFDINTIEGCNKLVVARLQHYLKTSVAEEVKAALQNSGIDAANKKFGELRSKTSGYYLSEDEMNALGYEYLGLKKVAEAIAVFKMNTTAFPESFNTYDSLGEAYMVAGEKELAIQNYEKSVQLNPNSQSGIEALKKLKAK